MPKNSKGGKRKVEEEEAEEEEEEGDENYERSVAAFESYEKFCDDGKLSHLKDAIGIIQPVFSVTTKKKKKKTYPDYKDIANNVKGVTKNICYSKDDIVAFMPVLVSQCFCHLGSAALTASFENDAKEDATSRAEDYFLQSLNGWKYNAAALSLYANQRRMSGDVTLNSVLDQYEAATKCAHFIREESIKAITDENLSDDMKVCIEILLLDSIGVEFIAKENESDEFSFAAVEATASFMCSLLASSLGDHDKARKYLSKFSTTHRIHPNVWEIANGRAIIKEDSCDNVDNTMMFTPKYRDSILSKDLFNDVVSLFRPDAAFWAESSYNSRDLFDSKGSLISPKNLIEHLIVNELFPQVKKMLQSTTCSSNTDEIIGAEWWLHHRPVGANLGHQLHFDTDEALLDQQGKVTHPLVSTVLYLTGGRSQKDSEMDVNNDHTLRTGPSGSTIIFSQDPKSTNYAKTAYVSVPVNNRLMMFPGNLLHGVLPCLGEEDVLESGQEYRLTFMVGFWTRNVPKNIRKRSLYTACGILPPQTRRHTWVSDNVNLYEKGDYKGKGTSCSSRLDGSLRKVEPAWERVQKSSNNEENGPSLEFPFSLNHRFFVREENPDEKFDYFYQSLFQK